MIPLDPLQAPALVLGMVGAVLVAGRGAGVRACGFFAWVAGNLFWVAYGIVTGNPYVVAMFVFVRGDSTVIPVWLAYTE